MNDELVSERAQAVPVAETVTVHLPAEQERRSERMAAGYQTIALKASQSADRTTTQRLADALIRIASSTAFLVLHLVWFVVWIAWNTGALRLPVFDPFPFGLLTMIVSLEAIVLAIFVLIGQ
ncbi:MAG: DUF1003 domain-containing protein, partial [Longimicrobiales bacterium]